MVRILASLLAFVLATAVSAGDSGLRQLNTSEEGKGWGAVGKLEIGGRGFCTGALIAPDLVLTAAHCLYDRHSGEAHDISAIEFRAGWRNGRAEAFRSIRRAAVHPDYVFGQDELLTRAQRDLALLELHYPIRNTSIAPFKTAGRLRKGSKIGVVSYAVGRDEAPAFQEACRVMGRHRGVYVLSCDVDFGSSGAPIFVEQDGRILIASVVAAKAELNGDKVALGTALDFALDEVKAVMADTPKATSLQSRNATGAKFIRP